MSIDLNDDECIHGMYPASSCSLCNGRERREQAERDRIVARWAAKFAGVCTKCGDDIAVGEPIARTADDRYVCGECAR